MTRVALLLAGLAPLAFAVPAAAQSMDHSAHGSQPAAEPAPEAPGCTPEHAAMGHCTPKQASAPDTTPGTSGTDLPPGDAPAPPPPGDWYADRIFPKGAMEHSRHAMMKESGGLSVGFISLNLAEYQARKGSDGLRWEGEAWYGGDINRS